MKSLIQRMVTLLIICIGCTLLVAAAESNNREEKRPAIKPGQFYEKSKVPVKKEFIAEELKSRSSRRAFYTAPPVIPHHVGRTDKECLSCHGDKTRKYRGYRSMKSPHPELANCQQCHVRSAAPDYIKSPTPLQGSDWQGLEEPQKGTRYHDYAPPTIPHREFMRENCATCHSKKSPKIEMRTTHSERANCMQCHVKKKENEFKIQPNP